VSFNFKRTLGLVDATSIVAGSMIGSGIFIVTSIMMRDIGSVGWLIVLWILTGLITVTAALSYGELAGMMPGAGGQYVYIRRAYGKMASFLYGWTVFTVIQTGVIAAVAVAFAKYAGVFFPSLNNVLLEIGTYFKITYSQVLSIGSIVVLTKLNTGGLENGKWLQLIFTGGKLLALFSLIILGLGIGLNSDTFASNFQDIWSAEKTILNEDNTITTINLTGFALIGALGATIINSIFSSDAWNNVTFIAGEIKNPQKNIPRSLFLGTFIVTIIYILANLAYLALLPVNGSPDANDVLGQGIKFAFDDRLGSSAASMIFGTPGVFLMAGLIMISTFGCNNGLILAGSRLFYAMSKDGLFFNKAGSLNKNSVPGVALWIQCIWSSILCLSGKYSDLLVYSTFASLLFYILTIGGLFILRKREPNADRPYKAFGYPFIPGLYILLALGICVDLLIYDSKNAGIGLLIVLMGVPVYFFTKRKTD
jgi:APA family basic amino acid/polyamine antiporter